MGFFGNDFSLLKTKWKDEYFSSDKENDSTTDIQPIMWNYELAPNLESNKTSNVSKHCIIPSTGSALSELYSIDYCYHFNQ